MARNHFGHHAAGIPLTTPPIVLRVAVQEFTPPTTERHPNPIIFTNDWCSVENDQNVFTRTALAQEAVNTGVGIIGIDPFKTAWITI
jgi:hypothetical protein